MRLVPRLVPRLVCRERVTLKFAEPLLTPPPESGSLTQSLASVTMSGEVGDDGESPPTLSALSCALLRG